MDAVHGRRPTTKSSSSSTGEPVAVKRLLDLDSRFIVSVEQRRGQQSPARQAADTGNKDGDEFLDTDVVSNSSRYSMSLLTESVKRRRTSAPSTNASGVACVGEHEKVVVVSETSESCKRSESEDTTEKETGVTCGKEASEISDTGDDSGSHLHNPPSYFGGSTYSLVELDLAYERASEDLNQEMKREDKLLSVIGDHVSKISQMNYRFHSIANAHLGEIVTQIKNHDLRGSDVYSGGFGQRLEFIKAYVSVICTEAVSGENRQSPVIKVHWNQTATDSTNLIEDTTSDEDQRTRATSGHVRHCYAVRRASNSVRKSRNVVVRQRKVMSKMCAVAERLVAKAEISCQLIHNCLKTVVIVLTPAVGACMLLGIVMRDLGKEGQFLTALKTAASLILRWTNEALIDGERAVRLHKDASEALQVASWDLDTMRGYQSHGARVLREVTTAADHFLELVRQPDVSLAQIRNVESKIKAMRHTLIPDLHHIRNYCTLIEQWSFMCGDTLSVVLQTLSLVTQSSCIAIEGATNAVVDIIIPAGFSLKESFTMDLDK